MLACLACALPAPGHYGGGGGYGGDHGHGHATSYQNYVLHSYHPVKVQARVERIYRHIIPKYYVSDVFLSLLAYSASSLRNTARFRWIFTLYYFII
jgi:hypothetical protein